MSERLSEEKGTAPAYSKALISREPLSGMQLSRFVSAACLFLILLASFDAILLLGGAKVRDTAMSLICRYSKLTLFDLSLMPHFRDEAVYTICSNVSRNEGLLAGLWSATQISIGIIGGTLLLIANLPAIGRLIRDGYRTSQHHEVSQTLKRSGLMPTLYAYVFITTVETLVVYTRLSQPFTSNTYTLGGAILDTCISGSLILFLPLYFNPLIFYVLIVISRTKFGE